MSISQTCVALLSLAPLLMLTGCREKQPTANSASQAAKDKVAAIAAGEQPLAPASAANNSVFSHPIDNIPEGLRFRTATMAIDRGDFEQAEQIRQELSLSPQYNPLATAVEALMLVKQGKYDEALRLAGEISSVPVMQGEAYVIAGEVFQRQNRLSDAVGALRNALDINPQHVRAHLLIGAIYYDTGAMRLATEHLRLAAELEPTDVNSLLLSAKIFKEYEQYQEAIQDYGQALERVTSNKLDKSNEIEVYVRIETAMCLCELRQLDAAREMLKSCADTPGVVAARAAIAEAAGEFDAAARLAREALQYSPQNRVAGMVLGRMSVTERNWEEAKRVLENLVKRDPYDHEPRLLYGRALVGSGDTERGQTEIRMATELKDTFLKFAELHQEAMKKPDDAALRVELGRLAEKLGKVDMARAWYQAALGLDSNSNEASDALKRLSQ